MGVEKLVEFPGVDVDHEHVTIAARRRAALDRGIRWNRIRPWIALVRIVERHRHFGLARSHDDVWNAVRRAVPHGAEIGMEVPQAARRDERRRTRIDLRAADVEIPRIVRGKWPATIQRRAAASCRIWPLPRWHALLEWLVGGTTRDQRDSSAQGQCPLRDRVESQHD